MSSRRVLKVAEAIREVVAMAILTDLRDPRIENVTVTFVEVSRDLRHGKIHVSIMIDDEAKQKRCLNALQNSAGYLQQKLSNRLDLRYTPRLKFTLDQGIKNAFAVTRILEEVLPKNETAEAGSEETDPNEATTDEVTTDDTSEEMLPTAGNSLPDDDPAE